VSAEDNVADLARVLMSEASVGTPIERACVGWTVLNRMKRNRVDDVRRVWRAYARNQEPIGVVFGLARDLLAGRTPDRTGGATHYYSPRSMPLEGESTEGFDVGGGLELVEPLGARTYRPGWAATFPACPVHGVRRSYFVFHRAPGDGPVT